MNRMDESYWAETMYDKLDVEFAFHGDSFKKHRRRNRSVVQPWFKSRTP